MIGLLVWVAGCAHTPTEPSPEIAITAAPGVLLVRGTSALMAVDAATGQVVDAQWSSSIPAVAAVSGAQLTGLRAGRVVLTAAYRGGSDSMSVKVVPNYSGAYPAPPDVWGSVFKIACVDLTGNYCGSNVHDEEPFRMQLAQTSDTVSAQVQTTFPEAGVLMGEIDDSGRLTLRGTLTALGSGGFPGYPHRRIESWSTYLDASGAMYGTFTSSLLDRDGSARFQVTQEMRGLSHHP